MTIITFITLNTFNTRPCHSTPSQFTFIFQFTQTHSPSLPLSLSLAACSNEVIRRIDEYSTTLVVEHISSEHSGNYTCIATNVAGSERFNVPVTVNVPPKWILQPKDSNVQAGDDIALHCQADGYPTPVVTWRKCF